MYIEIYYVLSYFIFNDTDNSNIHIFQMRKLVIIAVMNHPLGHTLVNERANI